MPNCFKEKKKGKKKKKQPVYPILPQNFFLKCHDPQHSGAPMLYQPY